MTNGWYEVKEKTESPDPDFDVCGSATVKCFDTEEEAQAFIDGVKDGSIKASFIVDEPDNLFIEHIGY